MIKVVKFGGSSLASAAQFKKVGAIIRKEETRRYVVPSAPGKRHSGDTKETDLLYKCYGQAILDDDREEDFEEILKVIKDLAAEHITMLIVSHEMSFARDISDRIIYMDDGLIAVEGTPEEVFSSEHERMKEFLGKFHQGLA